MILLKKWFPPLSCVFRCFLFQLNQHAKYLPFIILPLQAPISQLLYSWSDFFQGEGGGCRSCLRLNTTPYFFLPSHLTSTLATPLRWLVLKVMDYQLQWLFPTAFFPWIFFCNIYIIYQHFLLKLFLASASLSPPPSSPSLPCLLIFLLGLCFGLPVYLIS